MGRPNLTQPAPSDRIKTMNAPLNLWQFRHNEGQLLAGI